MALGPKPLAFEARPGGPALPMIGVEPEFGFCCSSGGYGHLDISKAT